MKARLVKKLREETHYPSKKVYVVQWAQDGNTWEGFVGPAQYELIVAIQNMENKVQFSSDVSNLLKLMEEYGSERWEEGNDDCEMSHAGPEL